MSLGYPLTGFPRAAQVFQRGQRGLNRPPAEDNAVDACTLFLPIGEPRSHVQRGHPNRDKQIKKGPKAALLRMRVMSRFCRGEESNMLLRVGRR